MGRLPPSIETLESRFHLCLAHHDLGLNYTELAKDYSTRFGLGGWQRAAKYHIGRLRAGIEGGTVRRIGMFTGPKGVRFGNLDNPRFVEAKEQAERPLEEGPRILLRLGGDFQDTEVRSEWTHCPVTNKIVRTSILTLGVGDFMECPKCNRAHFLGVNPKLRYRRPMAWEIDPLVNSREYEDALTVMYMGDPETFKGQGSRILRVRKGGHYIGLLFRSSWDEDPRNHFAKGAGQIRINRERLWGEVDLPKQTRRDKRRGSTG